MNGWRNSWKLPPVTTPHEKETQVNHGKKKIEMKPETFRFLPIFDVPALHTHAAEMASVSSTVIFFNISRQGFEV